MPDRHRKRPLRSSPSAREIERFYDAFTPVSETGCWLWMNTTTSKGYGKFWREGRHMVWAHRFSYELLVGPVPEGLELDHYVCQVRSCVNPKHLEPVTHRENTLRALAKFRKRRTCTRGHPNTPENLVINSKGKRECRACMRESRRRSKAKAKAKKA